MATGYRLDTVCYNTVTDAANAWRNMREVSWLKFTDGIITGYWYRYTDKLDYSFTVSGSTAIFSPTVTTYYVEKNSAPFTTFTDYAAGFVQNQTKFGTLTLTFPSCDLAATETDQITAVNSVFGVALAAVAIIWGFKKLHSILATNARE